MNESGTLFLFFPPSSSSSVVTFIQEETPQTVLRYSEILLNVCVCVCYSVSVCVLQCVQVSACATVCVCMRYSVCVCACVCMYYSVCVYPCVLRCVCVCVTHREIPLWMEGGIKRAESYNCCQGAEREQSDLTQCSFSSDNQTFNARRPEPLHRGPEDQNHKTEDQHFTPKGLN